MKKTFFLALSGALLISSLAVQPLFAAHHDGKVNQKMCQKLFKKMALVLGNATHLDLSVEQVDKIEKLLWDTKNALTEKDANVKIVKVKIKALMYEDKIDLDQVNPLIDEKYKLKTERSKIIVAAYAQFKNILSSKQIDIIKEYYFKKKSGDLSWAHKSWSPSKKGMKGSMSDM